jgi:hypothetical protein
MPAGNGAIDAHAAMHVAMAGQSVWQSGTAGFSGGQQGMSSDMEAVPVIEAIMAARFIAAAPEGVATGAAARPTTARTESKRAKTDQNRTMPACHRALWPRRSGCSRSGQIDNSQALAGFRSAA